MPQPTLTDIVDPVLTNILVAYIQRETAFVATRAFPVVPVDTQTGKYYEFDINEWLLDSMQRRAPGTESAGSGYKQSNVAYSCDIYALHKDIPDPIRANYKAPLDPERNAIAWLKQMAMIRLEIQWVTDFFTTSVWTTDKVGTTDFVKWSDHAGSDPKKDVRAGVSKILTDTGLMPNTFVCGWDVFAELQDHPDVKDSLKYTSAEPATPELLARWLGVERVVVASAVKATNVEGETAATAIIAGKNALLCYAAPAPGIEVPSAGYVFKWTGISGGLGATAAVANIRAPLLRADRIEVEMAWDDRVVSKPLGYFFSAAV